MKQKIFAGALSVLVLAGALSNATLAAEPSPDGPSTPPVLISAPIAPQPETEVTRAAVISRLWELSGKPVVNYLLPFEDVAGGTEQAEAIRWAASEKIANGYDNGLFGAEDSVTREQLAAFVYRYVQKFDMGFHGAWMFLMPYSDRAEVGEWAFEPVQWMVSSKLFDPDMEKLEPQKAVTAEEADIFFAALSALAEEKNIDFAQYGKAGK